jgi:hypothetical protein
MTGKAGSAKKRPSAPWRALEHLALDTFLSLYCGGISHRRESVRPVIARLSPARHLIPRLHQVIE